MTLGRVDLEVTQGEDWTTDVLWTNSFDEAQLISHPSRMDIKTKDGSTLASLLTDPNLPADAIPTIGLSPNIGLLQLHLTSSQTAAFPPGDYSYDLFVTTGDPGDYAGLQVIALIGGIFSVYKRYTAI